jgi:hypothetical protein
MAAYIYNGKLINRGGKIGTSQECCCDPYNGCCRTARDFYYLRNTGGAECYCYIVERFIPLECYIDLDVNCDQFEVPSDACSPDTSFILDLGGGVIIEVFHEATCCNDLLVCSSQVCGPPNLPLCDE